MSAREIRALAIAFLSLAASFAAAVSLGLPVAEESAGLAGRVFWSIRFPEALTACLVGGGLALSGLLFQLVLRNPLADPYVLGVAGGSTLGAVLSILGLGAVAAGSGLPVTAAAAFAGGIATLIILLRLAGGRPETLLLAGVVANTAFAAAARILTFWFSPGQLAHVTTFLVGFIPTPPPWAPLLVAVPTLYTLVRFFSGSSGLDLLLLTEDEAASSGVPVRSLRREALLLATLVTAASVALCGMLGFVGLVVPHAARLLAGYRHKALVPVSFLLGGTFLLLAHTCSKLLAGAWLVPVGVYTSLVGAPIFLWLLVAKGRRGWQ